jgi:hypothetical protein
VSDDDASATDWEELRAINDVAKALQASGGLTRDAYDELWVRGVKACRGQLDYIQPLTAYADPDWAADADDDEAGG